MTLCVIYRIISETFPDVVTVGIIWVIKTVIKRDVIEKGGF